MGVAILIYSPTIYDVVITIDPVLPGTGIKSSLNPLLLAQEGYFLQPFSYIWKFALILLYNQAFLISFQIYVNDQLAVVHVYVFPMLAKMFQINRGMQVEFIKMCNE